MKNALKSIFLFLIVFVTSCSSSDDSNMVDEDVSQTIKMVLNGQNIVANVTSATLVKAQQIGYKTMFIVAENSEYKFNLKLISNYNDCSDAIPLGEYDYANIQTAAFYSEFSVYHKINGNNVSFHFPDNAIYLVNASNGVEKKISATFTSNLHSVDGEDTYVQGVFIPDIIEITNGSFNNIVYTVTNINYKSC